MAIRSMSHLVPTAPVEVGVVSLVVRQPMRGRTGGGDGASGEGEGGDHEGSKSGVKNFKKFGKVGTCITYSVIVGVRYTCGSKW